ncbi:Tryptophan synthase alpha chain [Micractinium conductrix]|uniref:Tryptophan synthase alpha chain n=1 Tax=Micractinium conductrix TaxID=554055 RepID=A0A2P6VBB7_9CHLO|nr:Tryptophan synthase alpha chain [Micractinium conductrix]|eukprot:PSC71385.1 Tryptophan synthase alpha chain [Micractinium conductrix]
MLQGACGTALYTGGAACVRGVYKCPTGASRLLGTRANCASCGDKCHSTQQCVKGAGKKYSCRCVPGRADRNQFPADGCEASLSALLSCGRCGNACPDRRPGLGQACTAGTCTCKTGAAGASRLLGTRDNCASCGNKCHSTQQCVKGAGNKYSCRCLPGRADCNQSPADGCEASLSALLSCGRCGNACPDRRPGLGQACTAGTCTCKTGGARDLANDWFNCGQCKRSCPESQICRAGKCVCADDGSGAPGSGVTYCGDSCTPCAAPQVCVQGECRCPDEGGGGQEETAFRASAQLGTSEQCDACSNACSGNKVCQLAGGSYTCTCPSGYSDCLADDQADRMTLSCETKRWRRLRNTGTFPSGPDGAFGPLSMQLHKDEPFVAFATGDKTGVMRGNRASVVALDGASQQWRPVGQLGFTPRGAYRMALRVCSAGTPFLAIKTSVASGEDRYEVHTPASGSDSGWTLVGNSIAAWTAFTWQYRTGSLVRTVRCSTRPRSSRWAKRHPEWQPLGQRRFSSSYGGFPALAISPVDDAPYVVYLDGGYDSAQGKRTVQRYNAAAGAWQLVGPAQLSAKPSGSLPGIAVGGDGHPIIAFASEDSESTMLRYNGSAWVTAGSGRLPGNVVSGRIYMAVTSSGVPLVTQNQDTMGVFKLSS